MRRCHLFLFLALIGVPASSRAQSPSDVLGWELLPDSLMQVWHLDKDQIRRIKVIEEDYATEREELWSTPDSDDREKELRERKLGESRMAEIKGVLGNTNFARWQEVLQRASPQ